MNKAKEELGSELSYNPATVNPETLVNINLSGSAGPKRVPVNENVSLRELGVNLDQKKAAPVFPTEAIAKINQSTDTEESKAAKIKACLDLYTKQTEMFENSNGITIEDEILYCTVDWLVKNKGFAKNGVDEDKPMIKDGELVVNSFITPGGETVFQVNGTAVWG